MSSLKTNSGLWLTAFFIFSNFWIYRILKENLLLGIILIVSTFLIIIFQERKKSLITLICILVLLIFQYRMTESQSLTLLDNDQQRVQQERIRSYPPTYINLYFKVIWLKPEVWIEQNRFVIALSKMEQNLFENLNINQYFFGGSPRNNLEDFEKFPYFLLPLFMLGLYKLIRDKKIKMLSTVLLFPLTILTIIGNKNSLGPVSLFPVCILTFLSGVKFIEDFKVNKKLLYGCIIVLTILGFILQISYAKI